MECSRKIVPFSSQSISTYRVFFVGFNRLDRITRIFRFINNPHARFAFYLLLRTYFTLQRANPILRQVLIGNNKTKNRTYINNDLINDLYYNVIFTMRISPGPTWTVNVFFSRSKTTCASLRNSRTPTARSARRSTTTLAASELSKVS